MSEPRLRTLQWKRRAAIAVLWFERLWPALWPCLGVIGAFVCLALFGISDMLAPWSRLLLLVLVIAAAVGLGWRGLRRMHQPGVTEADRRLERESGLSHRPLAALADRPAEPTEEQELLWRLHVARISTQIRRLRVGLPRPGMAARDIWALRGGLLVALIASVVVAGPDAYSRLARSVSPHLPAGAAGPGTVVQGWITPPPYTGLPPVVLKADVKTLRVPSGSRLTVSVTGGGGAPSLEENGRAVAFSALDASSWQAEADLGTGPAAHVRVFGGAALADWSITLIPDQPPIAAFSEPPGALQVEGRPGLQTRFAWQAADDYGVASVQIEMRLKARPDAPPLVVAGPISGNPKSPHGVIVTDLSAHPWAGLPVIARVIAKDAPGQAGRSEEAEFTLPERPFHNPAAQLLIAIRRQLSLTPEDRQGAQAELDALSAHGESFENSTGILLNLRALSALLHRGREATTVDEAQARMWDLALALEEGESKRTAEMLEQARQNLRDALARDQKDQANRDAVERRMQELREAIQRHLDALADQARRDQSETPFDPSLPYMDAQNLDRLAQKIERELQQGQQAQAERDMAQLEQMLEQLQHAKPETAEARAKRREQQRQSGQQQQSAVQDMVQREGQLLDRSHNRMTDPDRPDGNEPLRAEQGQGDDRNQSPAPGPRPPQPNGSSPQRGTDGNRQHDASAQKAMRRALGELMQEFGDLTGEVPQPLGEADQAMRDAADALANGRESAANDATRRAIEALQQGNQQMGDQIARQFGPGMQVGEGQDGEQGENGSNGGMDNRDGVPGGRPAPGSYGRDGREGRRDPLGRPLDEGSHGLSDASRHPIPEEMEQARTRDILQELRRRGAERTRPPQELDYIDRLLKTY